MAADALLSRLQKVRRIGPGRHIACCPAHEDRRPSLSVRELPDGGVIFHCFAGCTFEDVVAASGVDVASLFPERTPSHHHRKAERRPFGASDALLCLSFEAQFLAIVANDLAAGRMLEESDRARLWVAVGRIAQAKEFTDA